MNLEATKHAVEAGSVERVYVRVRQLDSQGTERGVEFDYSVENLVDFVLDANQVYLEWADGSSMNHNMRYVEQVWSA